MKCCGSEFLGTVGIPFCLLGEGCGFFLFFFKSPSPLLLCSGYGNKEGSWTLNGVLKHTCVHVALWKYQVNTQNQNWASVLRGLQWYSQLRCERGHLLKWLCSCISESGRGLLIPFFNSKLCILNFICPLELQHNAAHVNSSVLPHDFLWNSHRQWIKLLAAFIFHPNKSIFYSWGVVDFSGFWFGLGFIC